MSPAPRIAVVGSYGVGLTFEVERAPRAGETVGASHFRIDHGGKGSNQAIGAARLGAEVSFLTAVGADVFGRRARELWDAEQVDARAVVEVPLATMSGAILVEASGENRIVIAPGALDELRPQHVDAFAAQIAAADVCLVQLEIPAETAAHALAVARRSGTTTVLNPAPAPARPLAGDVLRLVDHLTPNTSEARSLAGTDGDAAEIAQRLRQAGAETVVLTVGADGALLAAGDTVERVPTVPTAHVVDTTGAGDAFNAAFAVALAEGRSAAAAVRWGCAAGAHMVEHAGVVPGLPTRSQLEGRLAAAAA